MYSLKDKIIWLTGAGSGIGEALASELVRRGARVAATARNREKLEEVRRAILAEGGELLVVPADVTDKEQLTGAVAMIEAKLGPIDCLIANAGTHIFTRPEQFDADEYRGLMETNYGGMLRSIEAVLPRMIERASGYIVGMGSLAGSRGLPRAAAYGASKAAIIHFLESIRFHLKRLNIPVTIINPGFVKTPLTDKNDFYMPFLISAPRAATIICDRLVHQPRVISFPRPFNWIIQGARFLPACIYEKIVEWLW